MSNEWPDFPKGTILSLQRRRNADGPEQWTVSDEGDDLTVRHFWLQNGDSWQHTTIGTGFTNLAEVLQHIPELRTLSRGAISEYTVDAAVMDPPVVVSMLEASGTGGAEVAGDWPDEVAAEWAESDSTIDEWEWTRALDWVPRWARVNDLRVLVINLGSPDDPVLRPVLVDEGDEELVPIRQIARSIWHSESAGAPISWTGGNTLNLLAPGLGHNIPFEDSAEECPDPFPYLPETPQEMGKELASWVIETDSEVAAALALEPLDPDSVTESAERQAWERRLAKVTISFKINVSADAQLSLRKNLASLSELYRRTRNGLADPHGRNGQALAAALDGALDDGVIGRLTSGQWD
jgi:hypothetical protein